MLREAGKELSDISGAQVLKDSHAARYTGQGLLPAERRGLVGVSVESSAG